MRCVLASFALVVFLLSGCAQEDKPVDQPAAAPVVDGEPELDPVSGLKMTGDWQIVRASCTVCHSAKLVTNQRGTADQWLTMIRWMQDKQNLWQFDEVTEGKIIAYLAENYPPVAAQRRAALSPDLMPPNPYRTVTP
jgi:cytochrome c5